MELTDPGKGHAALVKLPKSYWMRLAELRGRSADRGRGCAAWFAGGVALFLFIGVLNPDALERAAAAARGEEYVSAETFPDDEWPPDGALRTPIRL